MAPDKYIKNMKFILVANYKEKTENLNYTRPAKVKEKLELKDPVQILELQDSSILRDRRL